MQIVIPIIAAIVGAGIAWGIQQERVKAFCLKVDTLEAKIEKHNLQVAEMNTRLVRIETDIAWIRAQWERGDGPKY